MLSEKRKSELAGISREQWEWEQGAAQRAKDDAEFLARAASIERIPIPPKSEKRLKLERQFTEAFPNPGEPVYVTHPVHWLILIIAHGINGRELRRFPVRHGLVELPDSLQARALNDFLTSGLDWVGF
jgi:hypothetical protein